MQRSRARRLALGSALLVSAGGVAVASNRSGSGDATKDAHVVGIVKACGGPRPFHRRASACSRTPARVYVLDVNQRTIAREYARHAHFGFWLQPGRYTLVATTASGGKATRRVLARAHSTVRVALVFEMK